MGLVFMVSGNNGTGVIEYRETNLLGPGHSEVGQGEGEKWP